MGTGWPGIPQGYPWYSLAPEASGICCCHHLLYNEPNFVDVKSILELHCEKQGFKVLFLRKFHCDLNPLEMVWHRAKYHYRLNATSSKEEDLLCNMLKALDDATLNEMRRYLFNFCVLGFIYLLALYMVQILKTILKIC